MEQFDQLLTCCVCLDRYRNPKLLPCQHSFCMEPCMEGLVDYVRRQVKCPECRAEHRIPYQGVQAFPTNVTLQRFLELHIDLTGELPDPTANQVMERCQVCSEKAYCNSCAHCEKKVCPDCKEAHIDVLKREITRLSSQVRRVLHKLEDALSVTDKNLGGLKGTQLHVIDEVDDLVRRFTKAIKDKGDALRQELESYVTTEIASLNSYKTNLETEISNIQSNCDVVDKHMISDTATMTWDDQEMMDTKDIFLKTIEFIRNFEYEPGERRIRFSVNQDPNTLVIGLSNFGDLHLPTISTAHHSNNLMPPPVQQAPMPSGGIMRSKSDHRLVQQYRDMDEDEKPSRTSKYSKYGDDSSDRKTGFRSRFTRRLAMDDDDSRVRFNDGEDEPSSSSSRSKQPARARVIETDEAVKGPLSGVGRLMDSTRVLEKMVESETGKKKPTAANAPPVISPELQQKMQQMQQQQLLQQQHVQQGTTGTSAAASSGGSGAAAPWRQSQEKTAPKSATPAATSSSATSSASRKQPQSSQDSRRSESESSGSDHQSGSLSSTSSSASSNRSLNTGATFSTEEVKQRYQKAAAAAASSSTPAAKSGSPSSKFRRPTPVSSVNSKKEETSDTSSEESDTSSESEEEVAPAPKTSTATTARSAVARERDPPLSSTRARAMSRDDSAGGSSAASLSRQTSRDSDHHVPTTTARSRHTTTDDTSTPTSRSRETAALERRMSRDDTAGSGYVPYRQRQQKSPPERSYGSSTSSAGNRYGTSSTSTSSPYDYGLSRSRTGTALYEPSETTSRLQSKYLNRSRHNLGTSFDSSSDYHPTPSSTYDTSTSSSRPSGNPYYTGRTSYLTKHSINDQHQRSSTSRERKLKLLSRSKSSHELVPSDSDPKSPTTPEDEQASLSSWARYLKSKYGKSVGSSSDSLDHTLASGRGKSSSPQKSSNVTTSQYCQKKRLIFKFGSRGSDSGYFTWPRGVACGPDNIIVVADSSNHRVQVFDQHGTFIKDFGQYGNGDGEFDCLAGIAVNRIGQFIISDRYNHRIQVFDPSGRWLRSFGSQGTTDGKFNYPWGVTTDALGFIYVCDKENHRVQVFQSDGTFVGKFGIGDLEHPHYIAVTCTNKVVVSDTGHHRVLIFDVNGKMINSIGTEGIENGQFKLPRGVAVDEQGYIFVGDSGNNRIQIFNPDGIHIRSFGGWGSGDAEFKGLEGIAVNSNGHALVCDRENHRIQVF